MRFSPLPIVRAHFRAFVDMRTGRRDLRSLLVLLVPVALAILGTYRGWVVGNPAGLLAGVALMAGMLIGAFAQITTLRLRLEESAELLGSDPFHYERDALDETVAHLLMAVLLAILGAVMLVALMNAMPDSGLRPFLTALVVWATSYLGLLLLLVLPRMYYAYASSAKVRAPLNGFNKGRLSDHYDEERRADLAA